MRELLPEIMPAKVIESWDELEARGGNQDVTVNYSVLNDLAADNRSIAQPNWCIPGAYPDNDWAFAAQAVVANTINYMFLNRDIEKDGEGWSVEDPISGRVISGANALSARIYQQFGEAEDITAGQIESMTSQDTFDELFPGIPMRDSRRKQLTMFSEGLRNEYESSVRNLIEASADGDGHLRIFNNGEGMVERLLSDNFGGTFTDMNMIDDLEFPHNKRANLTPILIDGRARDSQVLPYFLDIDKSGAVPDYRLPQALRTMGAIAYSENLVKDIDTWTPIESGSRKEAEIRGATARAAFYLLDKTNSIRQAAGQDAYTMAHLDFWLWSMGRELKKSGDTSLPHFTETTAY